MIRRRELAYNGSAHGVFKNVSAPDPIGSIRCFIDVSQIHDPIGLGEQSRIVRSLHNQRKARRRFKVERRAAGHSDRTRGSVNLEAPAGVIREAVSDRAANILIAGTDCRHSGPRNRVLLQRIRTTRHKCRSFANVGDGNRDILEHRETAVRSGYTDIIDIVAARIGRGLEVRCRLESHRAGVRIDVEQRRVCARDCIAQIGAGIRVGRDRAVGVARGILVDGHRSARCDHRRLVDVGH